MFVNYNAPTVGDKFVLVKLESSFPAASKNSQKAKDAIIADMVAKGADPATAEAMASAPLQLFPDGELKAIKTAYYSFNTYLDRVSIRWLGGKGAPKLLSIHMLDKLEQRKAAADLVMIPLIEQFKRDYSQKLDSLIARQGHYFDRSDYPTADELDRKFRFDLTFMPIGDPSKFDMGTVSQQQRDNMVKAMAETCEAVTKEYAKSLHGALKSLNQQLIGGKVNGKFVRFSDSNVTNLLDMVEANLNASDNQQLAAALGDVKHAAKMAADAAIYKNDKAVRENAANAAHNAASKLAGLF